MIIIVVVVVVVVVILVVVVVDSRVNLPFVAKRMKRRTENEKKKKYRETSRGNITLKGCCLLSSLLLSSVAHINTQHGENVWFLSLFFFFVFSHFFFFIKCSLLNMYTSVKFTLPHTLIMYR